MKEMFLVLHRIMRDITRSGYGLYHAALDIYGRIPAPDAVRVL
jgi:hypothetical protein